MAINSLIILGKTKDCLSLDSIKKKISAFNLNVSECNGHDFDSINKCLIKKKKNFPKYILAKTIKGKGFSIMENKANWHYWNNLNSDEIEICRKELG